MKVSSSEVCLNQPGFSITLPGHRLSRSVEVVTKIVMQPTCFLWSFHFASKHSGRPAGILSNCVRDDDIGQCLRPPLEYIKFAKSIRCGMQSEELAQ